MSDTFFKQNRCDRCFRELRNGRTCSWFTNETICMGCCDDEDKLKRKMRNLGRNPIEYEGCGYVPIIKRRKNEEREKDSQFRRREI